MLVLPQAAASLTCHQAPALLIDQLLSVAAEGRQGRVSLRPCRGDALRLVEACAQAVAVLHGAQRSDGAGPQGGLLVGVRDATLLRGGAPHGPAEAQVTWRHALASFSLHQVIVEDATGPCFQADITIAAGAAPAPTPGVAPAEAGDAMQPSAAAHTALAGLRVDGAAAQATARFATDLPVLRGHFPGDPLLPGVHVLALVAALGARAAGRAHLVATSVTRARWLAPVRPGQELTVTARWRELGPDLLVDGQVGIVGAGTACVGQVRLSSAS